MTDDAKKFQQYVDDALKKALSGFVGTKPDKDALTRTINDFFEKLAKDTKITGEITEIVGDTIKYKLSQPSFANQILPVFKGPFGPWMCEDGVVHVVGRLGDREVRACDFKEIQPGEYGHPEMVLTCLECLTLNIDTGM